MEGEISTSKKPTEVFNTLAKIKAASHRVGFNVWDLYKPLDPDQNNVISVSKFISVLAGPLKDVIGLNNDEISTVAQYFKQADGRIMYSQFCNYIQGDEKNEGKEEKNKEEGNKLKTFKRNKLIPEEEKYLLMMMTKIAVTVKRKNMYLQPYFQDYALVSKTGGLVSRSTIARVLNQVGVSLSTYDYNLLLRKYSKDAFTVCYTAFLEDLEVIRRFLEDSNAMDNNGDLLPKFTGRLDGWDLPQLPRPETVEAQDDSVGLHMLHMPQYKNLSKQAVMYTMQKIRSHLAKEKLLIEPMLKRYDTSDSGRMTQAQFRLVLAEMTRDSNNMAPLTLTCEDVSELGQVYADPTDKERILWRSFLRDTYKGFNQEELKNWPREREFFLKQISEKRLRERQALSWAQMDHPAPPPTSLQSVLTSLKKRIVKRNINLNNSFLKYDSDKFGSVSRSNLRRAMVDNCILCTDNEYKLLEDSYLTQGMFSYVDLLNDLDKQLLEGETGQGSLETDTLHNFVDKFEEETKHRQSKRDSDIIEVLAKVKQKLICLKIRLRNYLKPLDIAGDGLMDQEDFKSTLAKCTVDLNDIELQTIINVFQNQDGKIEYLKFCGTVDEESDRPCLFRLPLKEEMAKIEKGPEGYRHPFLNYQERNLASVTVKKLSDKISLGQLDAFKAMDIHNTGLVTKNQFMSQLHIMGILHLLSMTELDNVIKAFGVIPPGQISYNLDYKALLNAADIVYRQYKAAN